MKIVAIIQARIGSSRLRGKVLKKVLNKPLLQYEIERIQQSKWIDNIVVATTLKEEDDVIVKMCEKLSVDYFRGSEQDVLSRYYDAAKTFNANAIVRFTADCPLIDSKVIDQVISTFLANPNVDYVSNTIERTYPRGMDTEVFSLNTLEKIYENAHELSEREHVTSYILNHLNDFNVKNVTYFNDLSNLRLTVDTVEDFNLIKRLIEFLYPTNPQFSLNHIVETLNEYPSWKKINSHIEQKKY